jgi:hypothetical protein
VARAPHGSFSDTELAEQLAAKKLAAQLAARRALQWPEPDPRCPLQEERKYKKKKFGATLDGEDKQSHFGPNKNKNDWTSQKDRQKTRVTLQKPVRTNKKIY